MSGSQAVRHLPVKEASAGSIPARSANLCCGAVAQPGSAARCQREGRGFKSLLFRQFRAPVVQRLACETFNLATRVRVPAGVPSKEEGYPSG